MFLFQDTAGRKWDLTLDAAAIDRVRNQGIDFGDRLDPVYTAPGLPGLAANVLFAVVAPQAESKGVSAADFGDSLGGDVLGDAADALTAAIELAAIEGLIQFN